MAPDRLLEQLAEHGADDVRLRLGNGAARLFDGDADILLVMGHSAAGKSALLKRLGADRLRHDMDVFCQKNKQLSCLEAFDAMTREAPPERVLVLRNEPGFLAALAQRLQGEGGSRFQRLYLRRPQAIIEKNMTRRNADGLRHRQVRFALTRRTYYRRQEEQYRALAGIEVDYPGESLGDLTGIVRAVRDVATGTVSRYGSRRYLVIRERRGQADFEDRFLWFLDHPTGGPRERTDDAGRARLAGWAIPRAGQPLKLAMRQGEQVVFEPLRVERPDVIESFRSRPGYDGADTRCGFDLEVELHQPLQVGFATSEGICWVARIAARARRPGTVR